MRLLHAATLASLVMAGAGLTALAQTSPPAGTPPPGPGMMGPGPRGAGPMGGRGPVALFSRVDADANGRVTAEESWAFFQARFTEADRNRDGVLVLEEALAMQFMPPPAGAPAPEPSPMRARMMAAMFRAMDANRDGRVTQDELRPAVDAQFRAMDANADNGITLDELPPMMGRHGHGHGGMGPGMGLGTGPEGMRGPPPGVPPR